MTPTPDASTHVLLSTEGTYPYMLGGVSTWCDSLLSGISGITWHVLAITAGGLRREPHFELSANVSSITRRELWSDSVVPGSFGWRTRRPKQSLAAELATAVFSWDSDLDQFLEALVWCRLHPSAVPSSFRSAKSWDQFVEVMVHLGQQDGVAFSLADIAEIYQTLYWVARAGAAPTREKIYSRSLPPIDLHLVTAAGWAGIASVVDRHLDPKPLVLAEHGVYVREAYLQAARNIHETHAQRWSAARLARGLARLIYANADVVAPVTQANARWERHLGVEDEKIRPIYNGVLVPPHVRPFPARQRVVSMGRIDPLKDIMTALRAAAIVTATRPDVEFVHYGPVPEGNDEYGEACLRLHAQLDLGNRFRFAGSTDEPYDAFAGGSLAMFSSISEGFPVAVLEAMACGRPVVATAVGGVPEALSGCGLTVRPGDYQGLATGVLHLLNDPVLLRRLGERSYVKVRQEFGMAQCLRNYTDLISELTGKEIAAPDEPVFPALDSDNDLAPLAGDHVSAQSDTPGLVLPIRFQGPDSEYPNRSNQTRGR
jgi:polysaccharide biosynthesis protein PelF